MSSSTLTELYLGILKQSEGITLPDRQHRLSLNVDNTVMQLRVWLPRSKGNGDNVLEVLETESQSLTSLVRYN